MELCGEVVKHKFFGKGKIVEFADNYVTVLFTDCKLEKKFTYPSAFGAFLEIENKSFQGQIDKDNNVITEREALKKRIIEERERMEIAINLKNHSGKGSKSAVSKASDKNNIAFKCNYCDGGSDKKSVGYRGVCSDATIKYNIKVAKHIWCSQPENMCYKYLCGDITRDDIYKFYDETKSEFSKSLCYESQMLEIWNAGAGVTQSGDKKGKPMSLKSVKANSLALLTTKLPYTDDKDRFIFAVFLIDENYQGDKNDEGYVGANPKYRMDLSLDEAKKLKFWDYYFNPQKPERIILGSGLHRYLTDVQSTQILKKICEIKKGTIEEAFANEFLAYYCKIKKIDCNNIAIPNGALQRILSETAIDKEIVV